MNRLKAISFRILSGHSLLLIAIFMLLIMVFIVALSTGAYHIGYKETVHILMNKLGLFLGPFSEQQEFVLLSIRLPRVLLAMVVGAALSISGVALQGLFRNPLVESGLIGISSGAALMAVIVIVFSASFPAVLTKQLMNYLLPVFAFGGSLAVTYIVYSISKVNSQIDIALLLLGGVAFTALAGALTGVCIYFADDAALRSFTFWSLGDLAGASWSSITIAFFLIMVPCFVLLSLYQALDAFALGEQEAFHLGYKVERIKFKVIVSCAMAVGASVALCGMIGFLGLVVPHLVRLLFGPSHKILLPVSMIGGAIVLTMADLFARTVVAPAEIPIGIVTALLGSPFFIMLLMRAKKQNMI